MLTIKAIRAMIQGSIEPDRHTIERILHVVDALTDHVERLEKKTDEMNKALENVYFRNTTNP